MREDVSQTTDERQSNVSSVRKWHCALKYGWVFCYNATDVLTSVLMIIEPCKVVIKLSSTYFEILPNINLENHIKLQQVYEVCGGMGFSDANQRHYVLGNTNFIVH